MPTKSIAKLLKKKVTNRGGKQSADFSERDPTYDVIYLGNVLTPLAKSVTCMERSLEVLWNNYAQNQQKHHRWSPSSSQSSPPSSGVATSRNDQKASKKDSQMTVTVTSAGLKVYTERHGLTEYWTSRTTCCFVHPRYPRLFCWVYRRRHRDTLTEELRCHAALCAKDKHATILADVLHLRLVQALQEFLREKRLRASSSSTAELVTHATTSSARQMFRQRAESNFRPKSTSDAIGSHAKLESISEEEFEDEPDDEGHDVCCDDSESTLSDDVFGSGGDLTMTSLSVRQQLMTAKRNAIGQKRQKLPLSSVGDDDVLSLSSLSTSLSDASSTLDTTLTSVDQIGNRGHLKEPEKLSATMLARRRNGLVGTCPL